MKGFEELAYMDATAQAGLVRKKEIQPTELVEAAIVRIERVNPQINAVVTAMYDEGRRAASGPIPDGPFAGVPFLIKDLLAGYKGVRMSFGTRNMMNYISNHDSEIIARYKKAGLIAVGKTNVPELGILPTTEARVFGPCRNPWNLNRTSGGSSGGSAAAVAAGLVPVAHGSDGGGSIRIPASCCGIFGLKPTRGRNSLAPDFGDLMSGLVAEHVLTRSVRDSAAILDATAGYVLGDPYCAPAPKGPFLKEVGKKPGRLRIAYLTRKLRGEDLSGDCLKALLDSVKLCKELGHEMVEIKPDINYDPLAHAFTTIQAAGCAVGIDGISFVSGRSPARDQYENLTWGLYEMGRKITGGDYLFAVQTLQRLCREIQAVFIDYDVVMTSVLGEPPVEIGTFDSPDDDLLKGWRRSAEFVPYTPIANAMGNPAMSVPLFWSDEGLPIGTHFIGRFGDEATLLRLAAQLEKARPWKKKRPPVSA
jgi:amidase